VEISCWQSARRSTIADRPQPIANPEVVYKKGADMFNKILVALDDSVESQVIFAEALALAKQTDARLMLLHVLSPTEKYNPALPNTFIPYYYPILTDELMEHYRKEWMAAEDRGLDRLRSFAEQATLAGVTVEFTQNFGDPGRVICHHADDWGADLIITGRRGRSGLNELVLGSVSNYVLHHAACSVLTVQGRSELPAKEAQKSAAIGAAS